MGTVKPLCDFDTYALIVHQLSTVSFYQCHKEKKCLSLYLYLAVRFPTGKVWVP